MQKCKKQKRETQLKKKKNCMVTQLQLVAWLNSLSQFLSRCIRKGKNKTKQKKQKKNKKKKQKLKMQNINR